LGPLPRGQVAGRCRAGPPSSRRGCGLRNDLGTVPLYTSTISRSAPDCAEEARQHQAHALGLGGLVDAGGLHRQHGLWDYPRGRQRHLPTGRGQPGHAVCGLQCLHGRRGPDRGPSTQQRHWLDLLGHRAVGVHWAAGKRIRHPCLCDPPGVAAWRNPGRLVCLMGVVSRRCLGAGVHPLVVPHRSAAFAWLAAGRLAGRGNDGGIDGAGCPSGRSGRER
jgi:hypothetical protein